jgi:hypothetical protein
MWQTQTSGNEVWRYISWVAAAYILSRDLAKAGQP